MDGAHFLKYCMVDDWKVATVDDWFVIILIDFIIICCFKDANHSTMVVEF